MIFTTDTELYYEDSLTGSKIVIMLHGNGEDHSVFRNHREYFLRLNYRVILVDTRNHGHSGRGSKPFNFYTFAEDIIDLMDYLNIEKADFIGFSDGANTLIHLCLLDKDRVESCVLVSPNIFPGGLKNLGKYKRKALNCKILGLTNAKRRKQAEHLKLMTQEPNLSYEELAAAQSKILIISSTNDEIKPKHIQAIHQSIKGSLLLVLPGDHFVLMKEAPDVNLVIFKFFEDA